MGFDFYGCEERGPAISSDSVKILSDRVDLEDGAKVCLEGFADSLGDFHKKVVDVGC